MPLSDIKIDVKLKLAALWTSVMFLYLYADYFELYVPGKLQGMMEGHVGPVMRATQGMLMGGAVMMAIPSVMIFLSVALRPRLNRWLNIVCGVLYTVIILMTMWRWAFFVVYGVIEIVLTGLVVWYAWTWPKESSPSSQATS